MHGDSSGDGGFAVGVAGAGELVETVFKGFFIVGTVGVLDDDICTKAEERTYAS